MELNKLITTFCHVQFIEEAIKSDEYLGLKKTDHFDVDRYNLFLDALVDDKRMIEHQEWQKRKKPPIYPLMSTRLVSEKIRYLFKCLVVEKNFKDGKRLVDLGLVPFIGQYMDGTVVVKPMTSIFTDIDEIGSADVDDCGIFL